MPASRRQAIDTQFWTLPIGANCDFFIAYSPRHSHDIFIPLLAQNLSHHLTKRRSETLSIPESWTRESQNANACHDCMTAKSIKCCLRLWLWLLIWLPDTAQNRISSFVRRNKLLSNIFSPSCSCRTPASLWSVCLKPTLWRLSALATASGLYYY